MIIPHAPWLDTLSGLHALIQRNLPGNHHIIFGPPSTAIEARRQGLQVRDTFLIQSPGRTRLAFLLRKPLDESTVVAQVLKTGTGAINIDGCRVGSGADKGVWPVTERKGRTALNSAVDGSFNSPVETDRSVGRWPPNLLFVHDPDCKKVGQTKVKGHKGYPNGPGGKSYQYSSDKRGSEVRPDAWEGHADAEGNETIDQWECQVGCPVQLLDEQTGILKSGKFSPVARSNRSGYAGPTPAVSTYNTEASEGGASRFFPQFANDTELMGWLTRLVAPHGAVLLESCPESELELAFASGSSA